MMKRITIIVLLSSFISQSRAQSNKLTEQLENVKLEFAVGDSGIAEYAVYFKDQVVVKPSALGFNLKNNTAFRYFKIIRSERKTFDETWKPVWGEVNHIRNHYNELKVICRNETIQTVY